MNNKQWWIRLLAGAFLLAGLVSCASAPEHYNTQRGALIGAGIGALAGQAIGRNTEGTVIGTGVGTLVGAVLGNAVDQDRQIARETSRRQQRADNYRCGQKQAYNDCHDREGTYIETIPGPVNQHTNCHKITKRVWDKGVLVSESVEEVCDGEKYSRDY
jgi:uncharacterized protein YcfJ